jgi:hypothetical protein
MITPKFFESYCNKLFDDNCDIKTEQSYPMELLIRCYYKGRLVARLRVRNNMTTEVSVYTPDQCSTDTRFKWRFKHLLKKYTYVDRHKIEVIKEITKMVNSKFYAHSDDIWELIDQITDDVFAIDVSGIGERLMDKADLLRYGSIKWRSKTHEQDPQPTKDADNAKTDD